MKPCSIIILLSMVYLLSCSSTYHIKSERPSLVALNEKLTGTTGEIALLNGQTISVKYINISEDSVCWVEAIEVLNIRRSGSDTSKTPTSDIKRITYKNKSLGAIEWAAIGAVAGFSIGALTSADTDDSELKQDLDKTLGSAGGFLLGVLIGIPIGMGVGHKEHYLLSDSETSVYEGNTKEHPQTLSGTF